MAARATRQGQAQADELIRTVIPVTGMTCGSCEVRIQRFVSRLPHVEKVEASAARARVVIESRREIPARAIKRAINQAGYEIGHSPWLERDRIVWAEVGVSIWIVVGLAFLAQVSGLAEITSSVGDLTSGGILIALLLGLAAGVSTCAALVGGLVLALSAAFQANQARSGEEVGLETHLRPALAFVAGRIAGYGAFGALLGAIGASVTMPPLLTAVLMIVVAIVMTLLGTRLTGVSPRMAGWSPTLPMSVSRRLGISEGGGSAYSDLRAGILGGATFFLPCGFTQAIQVYALSTGSPLFGAAILATFAIGTAPGLLALAGLPAVVPGDAKPTLLRFVGVVVLGFAVINGSAGARLAGFSLPGLGVGTADAATLGGSSSSAAQSLKTTQEARGYSPSNVTIYSGRPTTWTIESGSSSSCASSLVVPSLNIQKRLKLGTNTINLPPLSAGVLRYSCAMGMYGGTITVVDPPATPAPSPARSATPAPAG